MIILLAASMSDVLDNWMGWILLVILLLGWGILEVISDRNKKD